MEIPPLLQKLNIHLPIPDASKNISALLNILHQIKQLQHSCSYTEIRSFFKILIQKRIGTQCADLYVAWADFELSYDEFEKAKTILLTGISEQAQPLDFLKSVYVIFIRERRIDYSCKENPMAHDTHIVSMSLNSSNNANHSNDITNSSTAGSNSVRINSNLLNTSENDHSGHGSPSNQVKHTSNTSYLAISHSTLKPSVEYPSSLLNTSRKSSYLNLSGPLPSSSSSLSNEKKDFSPKKLWQGGDPSLILESKNTKKENDTNESLFRPLVPSSDNETKTVINLNKESALLKSNVQQMSKTIHSSSAVINSSSSNNPHPPAGTSSSTSDKKDNLHRPTSHVSSSLRNSVNKTTKARAALARTTRIGPPVKFTSQLLEEKEEEDIRNADKSNGTKDKTESEENLNKVSEHSNDISKIQTQKRVIVEVPKPIESQVLRSNVQIHTLLSKPLSNDNKDLPLINKLTNQDRSSSSLSIHQSIRKSSLSNSSQLITNTISPKHTVLEGQNTSIRPFLVQPAAPVVTEESSVSGLNITSTIHHHSIGSNDTTSHHSDKSITSSSHTSTTLPYSRTNINLNSSFEDTQGKTVISKNSTLLASQVPTPPNDQLLKKKQQLQQKNHSVHHGLQSLTMETAHSLHNGKVDKTHIVINGVSYTKIQLIGRGGSSKVYQVLCPKTSKTYALKKVKYQGQDPVTIEGYRNEIKLLKNLKGCPCIVELIDAWEDEVQGVLYVVMEYGETDLANVLLKQQKIEGRRHYIKMYWEQMLTSVQAIHEQNIIHSDLKPANFLLVEGSLKLIDFGIAREIPNDTTNVHREYQTGTVNYMAPETIMFVEQSSGREQYLKVGRASDVWSLGCILYQMVYGKPPFAHLSMVQKLSCIVNKSYEIPFPFVEGLVGRQVIDVIRRCLDRHPKNRPSIPELLQDSFLTEDNIGSTHSSQATTKTTGDSSISLVIIEKIVDELACVPELSSQNLDLISKTLFNQISNHQKLDLSSINYVI